MEGNEEEEVVELMEEWLLDALGIRETRMKGHVNHRIHRNYQLILTGMNEERKYNVAIFLEPGLDERVEDVKHRNKRMMAVRLRPEDENIALVEIYAPHQRRTLVEILAFYIQLQNIYEEM